VIPSNADTKESGVKKSHATEFEWFLHRELHGVRREFLGAKEFTAASMVHSKQKASAMQGAGAAASRHDAAMMRAGAATRKEGRRATRAVL
jgi:hypothetical protein